MDLVILIGLLLIVVCFMAEAMICIGSTNRLLKIKKEELRRLEAKRRLSDGADMKEPKDD